MIDVNWPAVCRLVEMSGRIDACACSLLVCLVLSSVVVYLGADIGYKTNLFTHFHQLNIMYELLIIDNAV